MNVEIDGVLYVPLGTFSEEQLEVMANVLKTQDILSENAINKFIEAFDTISSDKTQEEVESDLPLAKYISPSQRRIFEIQSVDKKGRVKFKHGRSSIWNLHQVMDIQATIDDFDKVTSYDVARFSKRFSISKITVSQLIYNLQYGNLPKWIEEWSLEQTNNIESPKKREIQNNPQKRKESGYGWVL